jgi:hypothetical protein
MVSGILFFLAMLLAIPIVSSREFDRGDEEVPGAPLKETRRGRGQEQY